MWLFIVDRAARFDSYHLSLIYMHVYNICTYNTYMYLYIARLRHLYNTDLITINTYSEYWLQQVSVLTIHEMMNIHVAVDKRVENSNLWTSSVLGVV